MYTNQRNEKCAENDKISEVVPKGSMPVAQRAHKDVRVQYKESPSSNAQTGQSSGQVIQRIVPLRQTGSNCGMYAMAMALNDLIFNNNLERTSQLQGLEDKLQQLFNDNLGNIDVKTYIRAVKGAFGEDWQPGNLTAELLELYAIKNKFSVLGEAFDAYAFADMGKGFCKDMGCDDIEIKVVEFEEPEQMQAIINQCKPNELYVLFPYYAGERMEPIPRGENDLPKYMDQAHWAVIEAQNGEKQSKSYHIFEGNKRLNDNLKEKYDAFYKSNMSLDDRFDWEKYKDEIKDEIKRRKLPPHIHEYPYGDTIAQKVNLRGKAVLVGKTDKVNAI